MGKRPDFLLHAEETDEECPLCDGTFYRDSGELVCGDCCYAPIDEPEETRDEWEKFWDERDEYDGWYGEDRVKMVGGFIGAYVYGEGNSLEERIYS